jgi:starch synthase
MVSRLAEQKGVELAVAAMPELLARGASFVALGSGDAKYEEALKNLARQYPKQVAVSVGFDEGLAHRIEAGADIFLMPSRFEPCGLNQFYSMRYGTVPVVHNVGGLGDSVENGRTGFTFDAYNAESFRAALVEALEWFKNKKRWKAMQTAGMAQDFSWAQRVPEYEKIYENVKGGI